MPSSARFKFLRNRYVKSFGLSIILGIFIFLGIKFNVFSTTIKHSTASEESCKYLISYGISNFAFPSYIANNLQTIEQNYPYNGLGIQNSSQANVLTSNIVSYDAVKSELQPLFDVSPKPSKLRHNLFQLLLHDPGDFFDDTAWNQAAVNAGTFAKALKDLDDSGFGVDGILFDNEGPYTRPTCSAGITAHGYWNLPITSSEVTEYNEHPDCWPYIRNWGTYDQAQYQDKARERGKQIMQAMIANFPDIKFMVLNSPDVSCSDMNDFGIRTNDVAYANEMLGSFVVGLGEGSYGTSAKTIDGGEESYGYTTESLFNLSYDVRNTQLPILFKPGSSTELACPFIPDNDKPIWTDLFDIGFGLYNKVYGLGGGQNTSTIEESTRLALTKSDNYVWFYVEGVTTIGNTISYPQINSSWTNAVASARNAVVNDPSCDPIIPPSPTPSPTPVPPIAPSNLLSGSPSTSSIILNWQDNAQDETGFSIERSRSATTGFSEIATVGTNITTFQSTGLSANTTYYFRVRAFNEVGFSGYSNTISAKTKKR